MQVSEQMIAVLDNLAQRFGVAIDWSRENVLPYVQELAAKYIKWEISTSVVSLIFGVLCIAGCVVGFICAHWYHHNYCDDWDYEGIGTGLIIAASVICGMAGVAWIFHEILDIMRCCTFPELQILNYLQNLIR